MKPETAIQTLVKFKHPNDPPLFRKQKNRRKYYLAKYELALRFKPNTICEIGVRAGYCALMFMLACPNAYYYGIDANNGRHGGVKNRHKWAEKNFKKLGFNFNIIIQDSQELTTLPVIFDLCHVDGDHSYKGCYHDIELCAKYGKVILVDDYFNIPSVRSACDDFVKIRPYFTKEIIDDQLRGTCIIQPNII